DDPRHLPSFPTRRSSDLAVGVSLGGNVLLKWLGEREAAVPAALAGAVAISVPFDLAPCARALDRGFCRWVYTANFLGTMRAKLRSEEHTSELQSRGHLVC